MPEGNAMENLICNESVGDLYTPNPIKVAADTPVGEVIAVMQKRKIGAMLLEADGRLAGVFSERDLVRRLLGTDVKPETPVKTLVSPNPVYLKTSDDVGKAIGLMAEHGLRHLPVCSEQLEIEGILSVRQIIDCLAEHYPMEVINRPPEPGVLPQAPEGG